MLSAKYGWTAKEISQMTAGQQNMYLEDGKDEGNTRTFATIGEARAFLNELKSEEGA